jgi:predicted flap endonuclease-1-like 5' DNA nuclease
MSNLGCLLWWLVLGGLLGWLASWLFGKRKPEIVERIVDRPVEKIVDRPVDRIVEKIVDRPIETIVEKEKIVEKLVDNPAHLSKIATLSAEVATIAGLKMTIDQMRAAPPKIVEKIIDRPVEKIVEKIVDRPVDRIVEKIVEKVVDRPVEKIVEKIVDRPVEKIVEREKIVEKMVDNPSHLAKIATLTAEVAGIAALKMTIDQLRSAPPKTVEKIVEKIVDRPVDRIVEKVVEKIVDRPVEKIVEKIVDRPVEKIVEKIVDRPVDRVVEKIVEKIVDRPVDRIVEKLVDNPAHISKIATLSAEVATIAGLKMTIDQMRNAPPKTVEKIVEKIVDRPVEKIVEKIVDRPVDRIVEKIVEKIVDRPVEKIVEKIVDRPVDRIVEKIVDRPVDRIVEKTVEKLVDNPVHLSRIKTLETEVATIAGYKLTIDQLRNTPPKVVEKIVDRPVDRIVEKTVEKLVDNPVHLSRIKTLETEVATIAGFKLTIDQLRNAPPKTVEKVVEKIVDRPVDRVVEKTVEKMVDNPAHLLRIKALEEELAQFRKRNVVLDKAAAKAAGFAVRGMDDLEVIEGIGPKIAGLFHDAGIHMFWELAQTPQAKMQEILDAAGANYRLANPASWAKQSDLAANNKWAELRKLQDDLTAGVKK